MMFASIKQSARNLQAFNHRAECESGQISQRANDDDDAKKETNIQRPIGRQGTRRAGDDWLCGKRPGDGENRHNDQEAADEHGERE